MAIDQTLSEVPVNLCRLKEDMKEFEQFLRKVDNIQTEIECELDEKELAAEIDSHGAWRDAVKKSYRTAQELLEAHVHKKEPLSPSVGASTKVVKTVSSCQAKLPKLELPRFSGVLTEWQAFYEKFVTIVHDNRDIPVVTKFAYLTSLLEGEAKSVVTGLSITKDNYSAAIELLRERFGNRDRLIFSHIQALLNVSLPSPTVRGLWSLQDTIQTHVRNLESLGVNGGTYGLFLTPLILSRLPNDIRMEWARNGAGKESNLIGLLEFLKLEIQRRERAETFKDMNLSAQPSACASPSLSKQIVKQRVPTASAMFSSGENSNSDSNNCVFCSKKHPSDKCWDVKKISLSERHKLIKDSGACFRCLLRGHLAKGCMARCRACKGRHNELMCDPSRRAAQKNPSNSGQSGAADRNSMKPVTSHVGVSCSTEGVLTVPQVARVLVKGERGSAEATVMFDSGSDTSCVCSDFVEKIGPKWVTAKNMSFAAFGASSSSASKVHNVHSLDMQANDGVTRSLNVVKVKAISPPMERPRVPNHLLKSLGHLNIADDYDTDKKVTVDILIGLDMYWKFVKQGFIQVTTGLVAQDTIFGWVLSGSYSNGLSETPSQSTAIVSHVSVSHNLLNLSDIPDATLSKFWDLESIGMTDNGESSLGTDMIIMKQFTETVEFKDDRYVVRLPWKEGAKPSLLNNRNLAEGRLQSLNCKLSKNPVLRGRYDEALVELETLGIVQEVPQTEIVPNDERPVFYLPHFPVIKESKLTTKIRPVFDASAKGANGVSLNDCIESGPNLLPGLLDILIRFRRWRVAMTSDITKAFLQIAVNKEDQDVHRFMWTKDGKDRVMKFLRVPFGNTASPFLLNATIRHHLSQYSDSETSTAVEELKENLYVDDWITGADYEDETCELFRNGQKILKEGSLSLAKCNSNNEVIKYMFIHEFDSHSGTVSTKILGLKWLKTEDCFAFDGVDIPTQIVTTKRVVLSFIARLFDPFGF
ncbi:uncharacterized protein LOC135503461 [Lineus longissimus]|uniref:uncharacterized protein LOC135503461 n=1 Tax=Lineus longissimus TaxID=88925 RepID=UPI00315CAEE6